MNKYVYLIMSGRDDGRVLGVVTTPERATMLVNTNAAINYGMNITKADCPPLDYNGEGKRYGWKGCTWWQKEEVLV
jgi:hypothetical protein